MADVDTYLGRAWTFEEVNAWGKEHGMDYGHAVKALMGLGLDGVSSLSLSARRCVHCGTSIDHRLCTARFCELCSERRKNERRKIKRMQAKSSHE